VSNGGLEVAKHAPQHLSKRRLIGDDFIVPRRVASAENVTEPCFQCHGIWMQSGALAKTQLSVNHGFGNLPRA